MPVPESRTTTSTKPSGPATHDHARPPGGVNFTAFDSRLPSAWRAPGSPGGASRGTRRPSKTSSTPLARATVRAASTAARATSATTTGRRSSVSRRARCARRPRALHHRALGLRVPVHDPTALADAGRGGFGVVPSMADHPRMEVSGVRSSWEIVARNSSLRRFATSACWRADASRRARSSTSRRKRTSSVTSRATVRSASTAPPASRTAWTLKWKVRSSSGPSGVSRSARGYSFAVWEPPERQTERSSSKMGASSGSSGNASRSGRPTRPARPTIAP